MNELQAAVEAIIYAAEEPATVAQIATALGVERDQVVEAIDGLQARYASDEYGVEVKAVAGGYRIGTKPQHHESVRKFIKSLKPPVRLSLAALETLAVIAYRQPITGPEIKEIRGVDPGGVINTLLEKKLVTTAGRKEVVGKPILYKTTRDFLIRFGLNSTNDLPTLKEFEEMAKAGLEGEELPSASEERQAGEPTQPSLLEREAENEPAEVEAEETAEAVESPEEEAGAESAETAEAAAPVADGAGEQAGEDKAAAESAGQEAEMTDGEAVAEGGAEGSADAEDPEEKASAASAGRSGD